MTTIFGIDMDKVVLATVVSAIMGCSGAAFGGRGGCNLIKLMPGAGTVVGGLINGATAAAFTVALGEAYIAVMTRIARGELKREQMSEQQFIGEIKDIFMENFTRKAARFQLRV